MNNMGLTKLKTLLEKQDIDPNEVLEKFSLLISDKRALSSWSHGREPFIVHDKLTGEIRISFLEENKMEQNQNIEYIAFKEFLEPRLH